MNTVNNFSKNMTEATNSANSAAKTASDAAAVSYTHLDVYKRQEENSLKSNQNSLKRHRKSKQRFPMVGKI